MERKLDTVLQSILQQGLGDDRFPLTDIYYAKDSEKVYVQIALAGFAKENIELKKEQNVLIVYGNSGEDADEEKVTYCQRHIAKRDFTRKISLAPKYVGGKVEADFENGLLTIIISPAANFSTLIPIG